MHLFAKLSKIMYKFLNNDLLQISQSYISDCLILIRNITFLYKLIYAEHYIKKFKSRIFWLQIKIYKANVQKKTLSIGLRKKKIIVFKSNQIKRIC